MLYTHVPVKLIIEMGRQYYTVCKLSSWHHTMRAGHRQQSAVPVLQLSRDCCWLAGRRWGEKAAMASKLLHGVLQEGLPDVRMALIQPQVALAGHDAGQLLVAGRCVLGARLRQQ
jgi:hypothetical protein